ncbi:signal peptide peptidase SppA [Lentisphaerota bacterium WC36G]|nr:signal peptide peptidase SppA [Lentisphaerae bacterium WC36]
MEDKNHNSDDSHQAQNSAPLQQALKNKKQPQQNIINNYYPKKRSFWMVGCLWISTLFASILILLVIGAGILAKSIGHINPDNGEFSMNQKMASKKAKVAIIEINGIMLDQHQGGGFGSDKNVASADKIAKLIKNVEDDMSIKAVVLKINSPGGAVTAADTIYQSLLKLKEKRQIPIISSFQSLAASGGYYVAMASDHIFAKRMGITGSIGVIMSGYKYQKLLETVGVNAEVYKSGAMKDILSGTRPTTQAEKELIQKLVDEIYTDFVSIVDKGRPKLTLKDLKNTELTDGRVFLGSQAVKNGLVDALGGTDNAIAYAATSASLTEGNYQVITLKEKKKSFLMQLLEAKAHQSQKINVKIGNHNLTSDVSLDPNVPYLLPANYKN